MPFLPSVGGEEDGSAGCCNIFVWRFWSLHHIIPALRERGRLMSHGNPIGSFSSWVAPSFSPAGRTLSPCLSTLIGSPSVLVFQLSQSPHLSRSSNSKVPRPAAVCIAGCLNAIGITGRPFAKIHGEASVAPQPRCECAPEAIGAAQCFGRLLSWCLSPYKSRDASTMQRPGQPASRPLVTALTDLLVLQPPVFHSFDRKLVSRSHPLSMHSRLSFASLGVGLLLVGEAAAANIRLPNPYRPQRRADTDTTLVSPPPPLPAPPASPRPPAPADTPRSLPPA